MNYRSGKVIKRERSINLNQNFVNWSIKSWSASFALGFI